jgi:subtilase family serine protease
VAHLQPIGRLPDDTRLRLVIGLPLRNREALTSLLQQIYDPSTSHYHRYLTPQQFTGMFGPTEEDYLALMAFAKANGLTVVRAHPDRLVLDVEGAVSDIEKALHVTIRIYQHPVENRTFYAPEIEPSVDMTVPLLHISGLDNYTLPHPRLRKIPVDHAKNATPRSGSGPDGSYMGNDFRAAYAPGVALTGSGQTLGLLELDGYYASDIAAYEASNALPNVTLDKVLLDGFNGTPTADGNSEVALDIEMAISMAPGLSEVIVYEAGPAPNGNPDDILDEMANPTQGEGLPNQLSCSWGWDGPDPTADQYFQQMAAQGQAFFDASGDSDAFVGDTSDDFPSDDPYITQVGGTTLSTTGPQGSWVSETVWNSGHVPREGYLGSGGGISTVYSIPSWQQAVNMSANQGSTTWRNVPDVAMVADNVSIIADNDPSNIIQVVGTSCATPLWAGFIALANEQATANGEPPVGFINPAIYAIGQGSNYTADFHEITTGNNEWPDSPDLFVAVAGYNLCTGWGTPNGSSLIDALAGAVANLSADQLIVSRILLKANFRKADADSCNLKLAFDLGPTSNLARQMVTLDVGGAQARFVLDPKGKGHGVGPNGTCKLSFDKHTALWTATVDMKNGSWHSAWAAYGMTNSTIRNPGVLVTNLPVVLVVGSEAFMGTTDLRYTSRDGQSGTAK